MGFCGGSDGKKSVCNAGNPGSIPGSERLLNMAPTQESSDAGNSLWCLPDELNIILLCMYRKNIVCTGFGNLPVSTGGLGKYPLLISGETILEKNHKLCQMQEW